jgi:hypothetical protein
MKNWYWKPEVDKYITEYVEIKEQRDKSIFFNKYLLKPFTELIDKLIKFFLGNRINEIDINLIEQLRYELLAHCESKCNLYKNNQPSFGYFQFVIKNYIFDYVKYTVENNRSNRKYLEFNSDLIDSKENFNENIENNYDQDDLFEKSSVFIYENDNDVEFDYKLNFINKFNKVLKQIPENGKNNLKKRALFLRLIEYFETSLSFSKEGLIEFLLENNISLSSVDYLIKDYFKNHLALNSTFYKIKNDKTTNNNENKNFEWIYDKENDEERKSWKRYSENQEIKKKSRFISEDEIQERKKEIYGHD